MPAGPQQKTIAKHLAGVGSSNQSKKAKRAVQFIIDHVKQYEKDAETMQELVQNNQIGLLRGEVPDELDARCMVRGAPTQVWPHMKKQNCPFLSFGMSLEGTRDKNGGSLFAPKKNLRRFSERFQKEFREHSGTQGWAKLRNFSQF